MLQNDYISTDSSGMIYSLHTGNFQLSFLEPLWHSPGPEDPSRFELYPQLLELTLCLRGKGKMELNGTLYAIERGSVWFTSRASNAFWYEYNHQEMTLLHLSFLITQTRNICDTPRDRILTDFMRRLEINPEIPLLGYDPSLCEYSDFLKRRVSAGCRCGFESILVGLLMDALYALNEEITRPATEAQRIEAYVKANITQKISVGDLAKLLSVSERSLFYIFTKNFQVSPNDYINQNRMTAAAEHLAKGLTVREVSELFKFSESTSFCRMFKKYYHVTPSEYQKRILTKNTRTV